MKESEEFYNKRIFGVIEDYVLGIKRMEDAIISLSEFIPLNAKRIADLGCGLGWSSYEVAKYFPKANVHAIDLSPVLIENGAKLFKADNLKFHQKDITKEDFLEIYDCILMIDVYEHIPQTDRNKFNLSLGNSMTDNGRLILACPTKFYQNWLRENKPTGLQPVDEDIDYKILFELAKDIQAEVVYLEYKSVWNNNDYFYAVIQRNVNFQSCLPLRNGKHFSLEKNIKRSKRVQSNLNITIDPRSYNAGPKKKEKLKNRAKAIIKKIRNKL